MAQNLQGGLSPSSETGINQSLGHNLYIHREVCQNSIRVIALSLTTDIAIISLSSYPYLNRELYLCHRLVTAGIIRPAINIPSVMA